MRAIFVLGVVFTTAAGLLRLGGAEPNEPAARPPLPPPVPTMRDIEDLHFQEGERQSLQNQYLKLAEKQVERMNRPELKRGIAEMRRQYLISELRTFANDSLDSFDAVRAEVAAVALHAKDRPELEKLIRTMAKELDETKPSTEQQ